MTLEEIYLYNDADIELALKNNKKEELINQIQGFISQIDIDKLYQLFINKEMNEVKSYCEGLKELAIKLAFNRFVKDFDYILVILANEAYTFVYYAFSKLDMDYQCLQKSLL